MPEGDSIHRLAASLQVLVGQTVERATTQGLVRAIDGRTVRAVTAHGKHLVIELDDGTHVRTHLGINGRARRYPRGDGEAVVAGMSPGRASLVLVTSSDVYLWIGARTIEISDRRAPRHGMEIAALGPDVLAGDFDSRQVASRAIAHGSHTIGELLLDQRVAAGIGNIYKSEALFVCGIDPRTRVEALSIDAIAQVYTAARELMSANLGPGPRTTRDDLVGRSSSSQLPSAGERYFVYGRTARPCARCGSPISAFQQGNPPRWTWCCPTCQPGGGASAASR